MTNKPKVPSAPFRHAQQLEHNYSRHQTAGNHIRQGIELYTDLALYLQGPCRQSIKKIKENPDKHEQCGPLQMIEHCKYRGNTTAHHVEQGQEIGNIGLHVS